MRSTYRRLAVHTASLGLAFSSLACSVGVPEKGSESGDRGGEHRRRPGRDMTQGASAKSRESFVSTGGVA